MRFNLVALAALAISSSLVSAATLDTSIPFGGQFQQQSPTGVVVPFNGISSEAVVLYSNVPVGTETVTTTGSVPRTGGADEALFNGLGAKITSMQVGYGIFPGGPTAFDMRVRMWDDLDFSALGVPGSQQFQNLAADFTLNFTGQNEGAFITAPIDLTVLPGGGVDVTSNPTNLGVSDVTDVYVELQFLQPGTQTPVAGDLVSFIFDPSGTNTGFTYASPTMGGDGTAGGEVYWRDANGNIEINGDELRSLQGARANFVLHLEGDLVVPEPTTLVAVASAGLIALRRRRA